MGNALLDIEGRAKICEIRNDGYIVQIKYTIAGDTSTPDEILYKSGDKPEPAFTSTQLSLLKYALELIELDNDSEWVKRMAAVAIKFKEVKFADHVQFVIQKRLDRGETVEIKTPFIRISHPNENTYQLSKDGQGAIEQMITEARKYLKGERAQGSLFGNKDEDAA